MKTKLLGLVAAPLLMLSSYGFAEDMLPTEQAASEDVVVLSMNEMDAVTAGASINVGNTQLGLNINTVTQNATALSVFGNATAINASRIVNVNRFRFAPR